MKLINSSSLIIEEVMQGFMEKYNIPKPTKGEDFYYSWDFRTEEQKNPDVYFPIFSWGPSVSICCWNGKWRVSTMNMESGCFLKHMDFWGSYSTRKGAVEGILNALETWAKAYWLKRK